MKELRSYFNVGNNSQIDHNSVFATSFFSFRMEVVTKLTFPFDELS